MDENTIHDKLDQVIDLLHGDTDRPGLSPRLCSLERHIYGENGKFGMQHRVDVMWRAHVWLLCTLSAGVGAGATWLLK